MFPPHVSQPRLGTARGLSFVLFRGINLLEFESEIPPRAQGQLVRCSSGMSPLKGVLWCARRQRRRAKGIPTTASSTFQTVSPLNGRGQPLYSGGLRCTGLVLRKT
jgi:hypothetical protein